MTVRLREGDVVELKSGSPAMTVAVLTTDGVKCVWWSESTGCFDSAIFGNNSLAKVEDVKS